MLASPATTDEHPIFEDEDLPILDSVLKAVINDTKYNREQAIVALQAGAENPESAIAFLNSEVEKNNPKLSQACYQSIKAAVKILPDGGVNVCDYSNYSGKHEILKKGAKGVIIDFDRNAEKFWVDFAADKTTKAILSGDDCIRLIDPKHLEIVKTEDVFSAARRQMFFPDAKKKLMKNMNILNKAIKENTEKAKKKSVAITEKVKDKVTVAAKKSKKFTEDGIELISEKITGRKTNTAKESPNHEEDNSTIPQRNTNIITPISNQSSPDILPNKSSSRVESAIIGNQVVNVQDPRAEQGTFVSSKNDAGCVTAGTALNVSMPKNSIKQQTSSQESTNPTDQVTDAERELIARKLELFLKSEELAGKKEAIDNHNEVLRLKQLQIELKECAIVEEELRVRSEREKLAIQHAEALRKMDEEQLAKSANSSSSVGGSARKEFNLSPDKCEDDGPEEHILETKHEIVGLSVENVKILDEEVENVKIVDENENTFRMNTNGAVEEGASAVFNVDSKESKELENTCASANSTASGTPVEAGPLE